MKPIREYLIGKTSGNQKSRELCKSQVRTASILIFVTPLCILKHIVSLKLALPNLLSEQFGYYPFPADAIKLTCGEAGLSE